MTSTEVVPEGRSSSCSSFVFGGMPVLAGMLLLILRYVLALLAGMQNQLLPDSELDRV